MLHRELRVPGWLNLGRGRQVESRCSRHRTLVLCESLEKRVLLAADISPQRIDDWEAGRIDLEPVMGLDVPAEVSVLAATGSKTSPRAGDSNSLVGEGEQNCASEGNPGMADIQIRVSESQDPVVAGFNQQNLKHVVTVHNAGPADASGLEISETLLWPSGVSVLSVEPTAGSYTGTSGGGKAMGGIVTFGFEGSVVLSNKPEQFPVGQSVGGRYAFDSSTPDSNSTNPEQGAYAAPYGGGVLNFSFSSGHYSATATAPDVINGGGSIIVNRDSGYDPHSYSVWMSRSEGNPKWGPDIDGQELMRMTLQVKDRSGTAIDSIDLPLIPPDLSKFTSATFGLIFEGDPSGTAQIVFVLSSLTVPRWFIGDLAAGATESLTITFDVGHGTQETKNSILTGASVAKLNETDPNALNDSAEALTSVIRLVDLMVSSAESTDMATNGSRLIHSFTITNTGYSDASGVKMEIDMEFPPEVAIDSIQFTVGTFSEAPHGNWRIDSLPAGTSQVLTVTFDIEDGASPGLDLIRSTALLSILNEREIDFSDNASSQSTSIVERREWTNRLNAYDVNLDGYVTPLDVLIAINELNEHMYIDTQGRLPLPAPSQPPPMYFDVNGDDRLSPLDVLLIINYINRLQ